MANLQSGARYAGPLLPLIGRGVSQRNTHTSPGTTVQDADALSTVMGSSLSFLNFIFAFKKKILNEIPDEN